MVFLFFFSFFCSHVFFFFPRFLRFPFLLIFLLCFPILRGFLCFPIFCPICFLCFPFFLEVLSVFLFFLFFSRCFVISFFSYCFPIRSHFFVIVFPVFLRGSFLYSFPSFFGFWGDSRCATAERHNSESCTTR